MEKLKEGWYKDLKVGDEVIINERIGKSQDYPFSFVDEMANLHGEIFKIDNIREKDLNYEDDREFYNGDDSNYSLGGKASQYNWSSSMFTPVDDRFYENDSPNIKINIPKIKIVL